MKVTRDNHAALYSLAATFANIEHVTCGPTDAPSTMSIEEVKTFGTTMLDLLDTATEDDKPSTDAEYIRQLRDCLQDFAVMVEQQIDGPKAGKAGYSMRDAIGQWRTLVRDARNLHNREDSSYGKGVKR